MVDEALGPPSPGGGPKGKSKISQWVRKNKTLAVIIGGGGALFAWHELSKPSEEEFVPAVGAEVSAVERGEGPLEASEGSHEAVDEEINRVSEEVSQGRGESEREKEEVEKARESSDESTEKGFEEIGEAIENIPVPNDAGSESPEPQQSFAAPESFGPEPSFDATTPPAASGVTLHGKTFPDAKGSRIAGGGETGGKKFTEYVVEFPGKNERWQYFPSTGNWRVTPASGNVTSPSTSAASKSATPNKAASQAASKAAAKSQAVGLAEAVKAGGGGGGGNGGGGGGGGNSCPAGTVQNIQQNRAEVNRLTGEIQTLKGYVSDHPQAKQRGEWEKNIQNKETNRTQAQNAVNRGQQQPGCGNV